MGNLHRCGLQALVGVVASRPVALSGQSAVSDEGPPRSMIVCLEPGDRREAYLSAQQPSPSPQAWLPRSDEHARWTRRPQVSSRQGPRPSVGLIGRIRDREAFVRLRREGVRVRIDPLWCSFVPDSKLVPPLVAFAIGRATGSAVQRNRVRRRLRMVLRSADVPPGLYLFGASARANEHTFDELTKAVDELLLAVRRRVPVTT